MNKVKIDINSRDFILVLLIIIGIVFILESNLSLKSEITFGDEGFHAGTIRWIAENKEYPQWDHLGYTDVFKTSYSRPPLFHFLGAGFMMLSGNSETILKILPPLISALIGITFYLLTKRLYNKEIGAIATLILLGLPSFVTYTVLVLDEILFTFYMLMFVFTFFLAIKENSKKYWILSAIFAGLSILTKNAGLIVFVFMGLSFLYIALKERKYKYHLKQYASFAIIILLITGFYFLRNLAFFGTPTCYPIPLLSVDISGCEVRNFVDQREFDVRTLSGGSENSILNFGLINYINFAYGNYLFVLMGLIGGLIVFFRKPDSVTPFFLIILVLGVVVLLQTVQRTEDAARQLIPWATLLSVVSAKYWNEIYTFLGKYLKYLGMIVIVVILFLGYHSVTDKLATMENVKRFSPLFFEDCNWVKANLAEDVKILTFWGYRAAYSCDRIISPAWADIRLNDNPDDIVNISKMHGITHFFIQKFSLSQQPSRESYSIAFVQLLENNPEKFVKVHESGPLLNDCIQQGGCDGNIIYKVAY